MTQIAIVVYPGFTALEANSHRRPACCGTARFTP
jgi:hypothetical protein